MARRRYISTNISIDKPVNRMGMEFGDSPVLLYTWMIPHVADDATITGDPFELLNMVWPGRRDKTEQDIITALDAMEKYGLIRWDREAQIIFFPTENFYKYQTYVKASSRRMDDGKAANEHQTTAESSGEQRKTPENAVSPPPSPSLSLSLIKNTGDGDNARDTEVEIKSTYEQTFGTLPNETQVAKAAWYIEKGMDPELVKRAFSETRIAGKDFRYVLGILRTQLQRGIMTVAQAEADDAQRQAAVSIKVSAKRTSHQVKPETQAANADERYANFFKKYPGGADGGPRNDTG